MPTTSFCWQDGERTIHFGHEALENALPSLGDGYVLLTTSRALAMVPELAGRASVVYSVAHGRVDELAGDLLDDVEGELLVALGGGRVIDTAKALAAAREPTERPRVAAFPTTLSAAEMTAVQCALVEGAVESPFARIDVQEPALGVSRVHPAGGQLRVQRGAAGRELAEYRSVASGPAGGRRSGEAQEPREDPRARAHVERAVGPGHPADAVAKRARIGERNHMAGADDAGVAGRAAPGQIRPALEQGHRGSALRQLQRGACADHTSPDHRDVCTRCAHTAMVATQVPAPHGYRAA